VAQLIPVAMLDDVQDGSSLVVEVQGKEIAIFCSDGRYYAIDDACPHAGASLAGGHVENGIVTCPWHYWRFRLADGAWADNPRIKTGCYPVQILDKTIYLEYPSPS
jgi:nitrite reductase (NADH) small subunit